MGACLNGVSATTLVTETAKSLDTKSEIHSEAHLDSALAAEKEAMMVED